MKPTIKIKKIETLLVTGPNGAAVEMLQHGPDWNGLRELRVPNGDRLIVEAQPDSFLKMFDSIFPGLAEEHAAAEGVTVVTGSPKLILLLGLVPNVKEKP